MQKQQSEKKKLEEDKRNLEISIETLSNNCNKHLETIKKLQRENEHLSEEVKGWEDSNDIEIDENNEIKKITEENAN